MKYVKELLKDRIVGKKCKKEKEKRLSWTGMETKPGSYLKAKEKHGCVLG